MPKVTFRPQNESFDVAVDAKLLAVAVKNKIPIRFGCGACRCGTCAVAVSGPAVLSETSEEEMAMLERLRLATDGSVRMACKARVMEGECTVDLDFQDTYVPPSEY